MWVERWYRVMDLPFRSGIFDFFGKICLAGWIVEGYLFAVHHVRQ